MASADGSLPSQTIWRTQDANGSSSLEEYMGNNREPSSAALSSSPSTSSSSSGTTAMGPCQQQMEPGTPATTITLNAPNPAVSYVGIDPVIEENLHLVESVSEYGLRGTSLSSDKMVDSRWERHFTPVSRAVTSPDTTSQYVHQTSQSNTKNLLTLPSELIDTIFTYLTPIELVTVSAVNHALRLHAISDLHWQRHVQANLPGHRVRTPYPCDSWRELYAALDPYWFLTRRKLWFCDRELTGQMIVVRYDERRGCIEGYQLLATRARDGSEPWVADQGVPVHIHYFEPRVKLHLDKPILQFNARRMGWGGPPAGSATNSSGNSSIPPPDATSRRLSSEHPMRMNGSDPRFSNFLLTKPITDFRFNDSNLLFPYGYVWPPPAIPARDRLVGKPAGIHHFSSTIGSMLGKREGDQSASGEDQRLRRSEISDQTFQIRQWMEMGPPHFGVHLGEEIVSYATLDPLLYTPTAEKPWRGLWVGDYSGHGCEFLLINQPDGVDEDRTPLVRGPGETEDAFRERFLRERVHRGRLEAVKLTGDPNVPRGEYTFVADDLGENGFVGVAQEPPFRGTRVVKSKGHIAHIGFFDDKYMESQLLLLSHNRLAQYWVSFGHISFYERVNIDQFLVPK